MRFWLLILCCFSLCAAEPEYNWNLPKGFPKPKVPPDNPMTAAKVELGRYLFYDTRLSINGQSSCATCHKQELAFTDGKPVGVGTTGEKHSRGAMSLVNVAYSEVLTWSNPGLKTLEEQALTPMFGEHPVELGLKRDGGVEKMLKSDAPYQAMFANTFPGEADPFTITNVTRAIASFERSIISGHSPYDRYHYYREDDAVSESAKRGEIVYFSTNVHCFRCHGGFNFSGGGEDGAFHNTGLYNPYPEPNVGIFEYTKRPEDRGKFKAPTLRNIAVTAPYMHDGSIETLDKVLDHYAAGGRAKDNPQKDPLIGGFELTADERHDLIEFLRSLTDEAVLHDPRFSNPW
ncbi:MAG TPA: MbnH family di-heme enzyme [Bryobacteraceae bacterium]|nr:MbnH family di-heme enzyme [Bryobacteraceae bacterium]